MLEKEIDVAMGKKFKGVKGFDVYTARTELMDKRTPKDEDWFLE